jgi:hypothetical protein
MMVSSDNMMAVVVVVVAEAATQSHEQKVSKMIQIRSALFRTKGSVIIPPVPFLVSWRDL